MAPSLDIVIVNWNSGGMLGSCVDSIASIPDAGALDARVIVVDNASTDGSFDIGDPGGGIALHPIRNDSNVGFAAACNQGARAGSGDYILFLNPDTELLPGSLSIPVDFMEDGVNAGVAITGIRLLDDDGRVTRSCSRFPRPRLFLNEALGLDRIRPDAAPGIMMKEWDHDATRTVDQVMGAFFLVRRKTFESLGGFDESFFVYFEDVDFSLRTRAAGWSSVYLADAAAVHHGSGTTNQVKAERLFYSLRSRILFARKHFDRAGAYSVAAITMTIEPLARFLLALAHRSGEEISATLSGYAMLARELPRIVRDGERP